VRPRIDQTSGAERRRLLVQHVRELAADVLGLRVAAVGPELGFFDMGMDSLMAAALRSRLQASLELPLPATLTFNYPSVKALAEHLLELIEPAAPAIAAEAAAPAARREDLSEDALADLLARRLERVR